MRRGSEIADEADVIESIARAPRVSGACGDSLVGSPDSEVAMESPR